MTFHEWVRSLVSKLEVLSLSSLKSVLWLHSLKLYSPPFQFFEKQMERRTKKICTLDTKPVLVAEKFIHDGHLYIFRILV